MNSPLRLFRFSGQFRLHFRQNVKWFATELVKSGYLKEKVSVLKLFEQKCMEYLYKFGLISGEVPTTFGQTVCRPEVCNQLPPCNS